MLKNIAEKYNYLHFGLVKIASKHQSRKGQDTSLLRDLRFLQFKDSIFEMVETSFCSGPIYFNCFPNITCSFNDINILDSLKLNDNATCYKTKTTSLPLAFNYRIQYKAMSTSFNTEAYKN